MTNPTTSPVLPRRAGRSFIRRPAATCRANGAPCVDVLYPAWRQEVSGEAFDRAQGLALRLTDLDRADGRPGTPAAGYSARNWARADAAVRGAQW